MPNEDFGRTGELFARTGVISSPPVATNRPASDHSCVVKNNGSTSNDLPMQDSFAADASWGMPVRALTGSEHGSIATNLPSSMGLPTAFPNLGPQYDIVRKLGQGGMGAVYLGCHRETQQRVAIKVLSGEFGFDDAAEKRFQKEARLLAEVRHPNVANMLEIGSHDNLQYLVMELVEGTDLKGLLKQTGPLSERLALEVTAGIAEALSVAHHQGIVHRDLKPANVLLTVPFEPHEAPDVAVAEAAAAGRTPQVKLTDFGLARHVDQAESMALTRTGAMLGTPYYISPEQCADKGGVTPATDIYSLGATLFELLTGRPPFLTDDPVKLIGMHCFEPAPDLRKLNPEISDATAALVARMLQKDPAARYADAAHLLEDLQRLVRGDAVSAVLHPMVPDTTGRIFEAQWTWDFDSRAEELWPWVSNTERVNAAVGLPSVEYTTHKDEQGVKHRLGTIRLGWTKLRWEEHPFEWIEGQRLGVLREFDGGPFQWFVSIVELAARPEGGTRLTHTVRIAPRGLMGRLLAHIEVNIKGRKPLDRVYRRIGEIVASRENHLGTEDPYVTPARVQTSLRRKLDTARQRLLQSGVDLAVLDQLIEYLAVSPGQELARIRPRPLAQRLQADPQALTTVCLEACQAGLLELHWDILCPTCRVAARVKDSLSEVDRHEHCEACDLDFDVELSKSVELIFRVHPEIRQADLKTYCIGGPEHAPHVVAQTRLAPGESVTLDLQLDPGTYVLRGPQLPYALRIVVDASGGVGRARIVLEPKIHSPKPWHVAAGRQLIILESRYAIPQLIRLERAALRTEAITAADALRLPIFRKLFPGESVTREQLTNVSTNTLLGIRVANLMDLYATLGDTQTSMQVGSILAECRIAIESHGGKVIQEQDDGLLGSFAVTRDALASATELLERIDADGQSNPAQCRLVLHRGMTLSSSFSGRGDMFGRSVSYTKHLLDDQHALPLTISPDLVDEEDVQQSVAALSPRVQKMISLQRRPPSGLATTE